MSELPDPLGCSWPVDSACFTEEWNELDPEVQVRSLALASATLRRLTGYRVGGCPITVRPCKRSCAETMVMPYYYGSGSFQPHMSVTGAWVNSCGCHTDCACTALCEIALPGPVGEVYGVKVDGVLLDAEVYRVDGDKLVWIGEGECPWPVCQNLALPDTEAGTFSVEYLNSYPVDGLGAYAAGVLAMEFAQACIGNSCRLPNNVTSISRQGVSMEIISGTFPGGVTGIQEVDAYIGLWNPAGRQAPSTVWTPQSRYPRMVF